MAYAILKNRVVMVANFPCKFWLNNCCIIWYHTPCVVGTLISTR